LPVTILYSMQSRSAFINAVYISLDAPTVLYFSPVSISVSSRNILKENRIISRPIEEVKSSDSFIDDLGIDSIGMVKALTMFEKQYNLEIPPEDFILQNFMNIGLVVDYISKKTDK
ncbi:MAG: phosphopantetheine-binding protein, partial [Elusimicrobiota bacterium]